MTFYPEHDSNAAKPQGQSSSSRRHCILICQHRSCLRMGSEQVLKAFQAFISPTLMVSASSCLGLCGGGPNVRVIPDDIWYCRVRPEDALLIFDQHIQGGNPVKRLLHPRLHLQYDAYSYNAAKSEDADSDSEI